MATAPSRPKPFSDRKHRFAARQFRVAVEDWLSGQGLTWEEATVAQLKEAILQAGIIYWSIGAVQAGYPVKRGMR